MTLAACIQCIPMHVFGKGYQCALCGGPVGTVPLPLPRMKPPAKAPDYDAARAPDCDTAKEPDYDAAKDSHDSYYAAIDAKRQRGDAPKPTAYQKASMEARGYRMRPDGTYFKPGS